MLFQKTDLSFQPLRPGNIVRVHAGDVFSLRLRDAGIQRGRKTSVFRMPDDPDPFVPVFISFQIPGGFPVRSVVADDQLPALQGLRQDGTDRFFQLFCVVLVVDAHHYRNQYVRHFLSPWIMP